MIRQAHLTALVRALLMGCTVLLMVVGCAGMRSDAPQEEEQGHTEATKEQTHSSGAASSEEARCEGTRTIKKPKGFITTNDIPGCPYGGLLSGTDKEDSLDGGIDSLDGLKGEDEIHGLGGSDALYGGLGDDVLYGGPGDDTWLTGGPGDDVIYGGDGNDGGRTRAPPKYLGRGHDVIFISWPKMVGGPGEDVIYGGDGNDFMSANEDKQRDKLYCGEGMDHYLADKNDYVDSSCEINGGTGYCGELMDQRFADYVDSRCEKKFGPP